MNQPTNQKTPAGFPSDRLLDCVGLLCPMPVVKASQVLKAMEPGQILEILADDQGVKADFPALCKGAGHEWLGFTQEGRVVRAWIRRK